MPDESIGEPAADVLDPVFSLHEEESASDFLDLYSQHVPGPYHRLGGRADPVQDAMELEVQLVTNGVDINKSGAWVSRYAQELTPGARDWRLLLQVDSDDNPGMCWGDLGMLYYWIREQDLRALRFDRTWLVMQCS